MMTWSAASGPLGIRLRSFIWPRFALASLLVLLPMLSAAGAVSALATPALAPTALRVAQQSGALRRIIVQLEAPAAARAFGGRDDLGADPSLEAELSAYLEGLEVDQSVLADAVAAELPGAAVTERYRWALNGVAVALPGEDADDDALTRLRALPGVRAVFEEQSYRPALYSSLASIDAPTLWAALGGQSVAGDGIRIAVLDSGIDIAHPMFSPAGFTYPTGFPLGDSRYTTAKVIAARAYIRPTDPPVTGEEAPVPGASGSAHGTHVAGVAAGIPVTATVNGLSLPLSGVAPRAYLMNYRIFYPSASFEFEEARSVEVVKALDDAVADGANVILSSWANASPRLPFATAEGAAVAAAIEAGVVVVSAAGNDGPAIGSASRLLGGFDPTLSVGAVSKSPVIRRNNLDVTGPGEVPAGLRDIPLGVALFGPQLDRVFGPAPYLALASIVTGTMGLGCTQLTPGILNGQITVIERGECPFADKVFYAQQAGATAVIIHNTEEAAVDFACSGDFCDPGEIGIPAVMVAESAGEALVAWRTENPTATLQIDPSARLAPSPEGVVWEGSARGPAFVRYLKPDLVAPGVGVLSANHPTEADTSLYTQMTGTSVAAAHAAGAAALLLQAHPTWGHAEVKAALMGAARVGGVWSDAAATVPAGVLDRGAGHLDVADAAAAPLLAIPPSLSFAPVNAGRTYTAELGLRDVRVSGETLTYTPTVSAAGGIAVSLPEAVEVAPGDAVTVPVVITVGTAVGPGDATADLFLASGEQGIHLPLWAHIVSTVEAADVLLIDNDFSNFDTFTDYARVITPALEALPYSYAYWDADLRFDNPQTIPDLATLRRYPTIIWLTGDNKSPFGTFLVDTPLTPIDLQLLASYLDGGGRLLAIGQNLAQASDVNPNPDPVFGRADLVHYYLGAHWLQGNVFASGDASVQPPPNEVSVVGLGDSFMRGVALDLGSEGEGEVNQTSIDEIAPGGLSEGVDGTGPADRDLVRPILQAVDGRPVGAGYVGVAKADEPTIEEPTPEIPYRSAYLSFGVEGVKDRSEVTSRVELLRRALDWLSDEVSVELLPTAAGVLDLTRLEVRAESSTGAAFERFVWRISSGDGVLESVTSSEPFIHFAFPAPGDYVVAVEAIDTLGHHAIDTARVTAIPGGGSTLLVDRVEAAPDDTLVYRAILRNTGTTTATALLTLTLPAGTTYVSHAGAGATFDETTRTFAFPATLVPNEMREATLAVRIDRGLLPGATIVAVATVTVDGQTFERVARTSVLGRVRFPLVAKDGRL